MNKLGYLTREHVAVLPKVHDLYKTASEYAKTAFEHAELYLDFLKCVQVSRDSHFP